MIHILGNEFLKVFLILFVQLVYVYRSEELRRARNEEARQLIGQRSSNPRAVFERNTSVGQLNYRRQTSSSSSTSVTTAAAHHVTSEEPKPKLASPVAAKETFQGEHCEMLVNMTSKGIKY